jgi:predicted TPR repeat methyltransferase
MITEEQLKAIDNLKPGEKFSFEVSAEEMLMLAKRAHQAGQKEAAQDAYQKLLKFDPDNVEVQHFLGLLLCQTKGRKRGLELIEASLRSKDAESGWWSNYGNILRSMKRRNEAIDAYREALRIDPNSADAYNNLGIVQKDKHNFEIAIECFKKAIDLQPDMAAAWANMGNLLVTMGRIAEGAHALMTAATHAKLTDPQGRRMLSLAYASLGQYDKAREVLLEWLAEEPDNPMIKHHLAAVSGETPARASDAYVERLFNAFADTFDERLAYLKYVAPALVIEETGKHLGEARAAARIADAGCGTGLCGPGLRPYASRLIGIDLSEKMVDLAMNRGCYDMLLVNELTAFFEGTDERFDAIVSADTLCYFGDIAAAVAAFRRCLRPGGGLIFTVESHTEADGAPFRLNHHGRYSHSEDYVRDVLGAAGYRIDSLRDEVLRMETGKEVRGYVVRAALTAA